jgi:hypothetical protein
MMITLPKIIENIVLHKQTVSDGCCVADFSVFTLLATMIASHLFPLDPLVLFLQLHFKIANISIMVTNILYQPLGTECK